MSTRMVGLVARLPLTSLFAAVILAGMVATALSTELHARLVDAVALTWPREADLQWWRLPLSDFVQEDPGISWGIVVLLPALPLAEARWGTSRAALCFFGGDAAASLGVLGAWHLLALAGVSGAGAAAAEPNVGSSTGLFALVAAVAVGLPTRRSRRAGLGLLAVVLLAALLLDRELADVQHIVAAVTGAGIAVALLAGRGHRSAGGHAHFSSDAHLAAASSSSHARARRRG